MCGQDGGILTEFFFFLRVYGPGRILTAQALPIMDLLIGFTVNNGARVTGNPERARYLHLGHVGSQSRRRICLVLPARSQPYNNACLYTPGIYGAKTAAYRDQGDG